MKVESTITLTVSLRRENLEFKTLALYLFHAVELHVPWFLAIFKIFYTKEGKSLNFSILSYIHIHFPI